MNPKSEVGRFSLATYKGELTPEVLYLWRTVELSTDEELMSQEDFGRRIGYCKNTIYNMENGRTEIPKILKILFKTTCQNERLRLKLLENKK